MLVSLNWVKKFVDIKISDDELIPKIASQIAEIEEVISLKDKYKGVIVAEIKEAKDHPNADKLGVYQIETGSGITQVCAGDKTLKPGDKVAYIPPGFTVPSSYDNEPFVIQKRPLRGEDSNGMMCSSAELAFDDNHESVMKLDTDAAPGATIIEAYELDDLIIEVENKTLTHRPDCFGVIGFAREVAGITDTKFKSPDNYLKSNIESSNDLSLSVSIECDDVCSRYVGVILDSIHIKPSPILLQSYLSRVGVRPINNVVDITNYVMIETGQPLHAFDYDKIKKLSKDEASIIVRKPIKSEEIKLLDGNVIQPHSNAILISTDKEAVAVGGVMGGESTEVDKNSKRIILESANFDLYNIRKTSMKHGLFTEAVTRFIRGQSPEQCLNVAGQAINMLKELSGAKVASKVIDVYPNKKKLNTININKDFINNRLGSDFSAEKIARILSNVEIQSTHEGDHLTVTPPFWRQDLNIKEDIVEEAGRLDGYDLLGSSLPTKTIESVDLDDLHKMRQLIRNNLSSFGANEILTYNFISEELFNKSGLNEKIAYELRNSLSPELKYLRTTLLPSLLEKVYGNIRAGYSEFAIFEVNKSHRKNNVVDDLPVEEESIALVYSADEKFKTEKLNGAAYYQAKQFMDNLLHKLKIYEYKFEEINTQDDDWTAVRANMFSDTRSAAVIIDGEIAGIIGEIKPSIAKSFKLPKYSSAFELQIPKLTSSRSTFSTYTRISKFPATEQDITFKVSAKAKASELLKMFSERLTDENIESEVNIKDIYQKVSNSKNVTLNVRLRNMNKTLETKEVSKIVESSANKVKEKFKATIV